MTGPVALALEGVRVRYGPTVAVDGVSLHVRRGEVVGLLGPNGSGKSTTLAAAAGVLDPFAGTVAVEGVRRDQDPDGYARRVGLVPQEPALYDELSAEANLSFFGRLYGLNEHDLRVPGRGRPGAGRARRPRAATGSAPSPAGCGSGSTSPARCCTTRRCCCWTSRPRPWTRPAGTACSPTLHDLRDDGHAVLLTTHHLDEAEHGCDRIAVLDQGRVVAGGKPAELLRVMPAGRAVLYGHLRERLPRFFVKGLRRAGRRRRSNWK